MSKDQKKTLHNIVNASGFLFQLRIEDEVKQTFIDKHNWKVVSCEHPWENTETGMEGFIDLVLEDSRHEVMRMIVECKRPRDASWIFLIPHKQNMSERRARCHWTHFLKDQKPLAGWYEFGVLPESPEAEFCVIRGQGEDTKPMLERIAANLIDATESLATEELQLTKRNNHELPRVYIPAIITTARLVVCQFELDKVSIDNGKLSEAEFKPVPSVRFRKSLTTKQHTEADLKYPENLKEVLQEAERTVFIIHATALVNLLSQWKLTKLFEEEAPWNMARRTQHTR